MKIADESLKMSVNLFIVYEICKLKLKTHHICVYIYIYIYIIIYNRIYINKYNWMLINKQI